MTSQNQPTETPRIASDRQATELFDIYKFHYGAEAAWKVWDAAAEIALADGRSLFTATDWIRACNLPESTAERDQIIADQEARAAYEIARVRAAASGQPVELQPGAAVLPDGGVRLSVEWILEHAEKAE